MIAVIVETADRPAGVERGVVERQVFGFGPGESAGHLGMPARAGFELRPGDVHAVNGPVRRQKPEVFAAADSDFESSAAVRLRDRAHDEGSPSGPGERRPGSSRTLFPRSELDPAGPVVEAATIRFRPRERADRLEDAVAHRISAAAHEAVSSPAERL